MMRRRLVGKLGAACLMLMALIPVAGAEMPLAELRMGMFRIEAEVAATDANRQLGLMNREKMPTYHGMVFVFPYEARHCMWMKNTLLGLSVAFLDGEGKILNIEDMTPLTEDNHCAAAAARYALEMNHGWFGAHGFKAGDVVQGVKNLPRGF
ncbi:hypothetical protein FACS1894116_06620 [Betaproteobacteria bacterium]|nr:hypothetical protein AGMMS49543_18680 [Betaproteobacteria bacterium]GHT93809.1 hypothetical protein FACS1894116_06620 [Betaproteobacteria bacterium]GHT99944.1 hypothetical protein FACS1894154_08090 [Betaproteobacteria bacterium]GHU04408.1 hypothetical protein AGMMS49960_20060 [Betaproteobacteria bacterium]GHU08419.1 hypothetical protein AGMMS50225_07030 [Betaproteobacteria bacterium]